MHLLPALCKRLSPLPIEVVENATEPPSPWAGYRCCITDLPDCSHLLIVQDDAVPCENVVPALEQIAQAQPDLPVCLFLSRLPRDVRPRPDRALKMNRRYLNLSWRSFMPIVAVLWPRTKLEEFAVWADEHPQLPAQREPRSDDAMAGRWKMVTRQHVLATCPSLFDHPDTEPSTIRRGAQWGKQQPRTAVHFAVDGMAYDWASP